MIRLLFVVPGIIIVALVLYACEPTPQVTPLKVRVNDIFPSLTVKDFKGNKKEITFVGDKITVLNIWATWCGPCRHEMPSLQRLSDQLDAKQFQVIGISVDSDDHIAREFLIDRKITFTNYLDIDSTNANERIGIRAYPSTFIIDKKGRLKSIEEKWRYWDEREVIAELQQVAMHK